MGITAELKGFIDRGQYLWARKFIFKTLYFTDEHIKRHKGLFVSTAGQNWDHVFNGAIPSVKCFFHVIDVRDKDIHYLMVNGVDEKGAILKHPTARKDAERLARGVITDIRARLSG